MAAESWSKQVRRCKDAYDEAMGMDEVDAFLELWKLAMKMAKKLDDGR